MLCRDIPASVVYFVVYELVRDVVLASRRRVGDVATSLLAGGTAGVVSWSVIFPIDIVKSRLQADYQRVRYPAGWRQCVADIWKTGAGRPMRWKVFYVGMTPCLLRAFPVNAVTFAVNYEVLKLLHGKPGNNIPL